MWLIDNNSLIITAIGCLNREHRITMYISGESHNRPHTHNSQNGMYNQVDSIAIYRANLLSLLVLSCFAFIRIYFERIRVQEYIPTYLIILWVWPTNETFCRFQVRRTHCRAHNVPRSISIDPRY